jgi:hypothetical protein
MEVIGQLHVRIVLPPGKEIPFPVNRRICDLQNRSGRSREYNPSLPARNLVTVMTTEETISYSVHCEICGVTSFSTVALYLQ